MEDILHQLIGSLSHHLQGFLHPSWCRISSINSTNAPPFTDLLWICDENFEGARLANVEVVCDKVSLGDDLMTSRKWENVVNITWTKSTVEGDCCLPKLDKANVPHCLSFWGGWPPIQFHTAYVCFLFSVGSYLLRCLLSVSPPMSRNNVAHMEALLLGNINHQMVEVALLQLLYLCL